MHQLIVTDLTYLETVFSDALVNVLIVRICAILELIARVRYIRLALNRENGDEDFAAQIFGHLIAFIGNREDEQLREVGVFDVGIRLRVDTGTSILDLNETAASLEPRVARVPQAIYLAHLENQA